MQRLLPLLTSLWAGLVALGLAHAAAVPQDAEGQLRPDCERCDCTSQGGIFHLQCNLNGTEALLDGRAPLNFDLHTLYMRLQDAASVHVTVGFLRLLRRYQSVALDLWGIGQIRLPTDFRPANRFQFIGIGIANSSLPVLPEGVFSNSRIVGLRLSRVSIGTMQRGAFANIQKVRYVEFRHCRVDTIEGPQAGVIALSPRHDLHHGSRGLLVDNSHIGVIQARALAVATADPEEFVKISDSHISEIGREGLTVVGSGSVHIKNTHLNFLNTRSIAAEVTGAIIFNNVTITSTAPMPLSGVRGGNQTQLHQVTFAEPASASLVMLESPTGQESVWGLRFGCGGNMDESWVRELERTQTVASSEKWYLRKVTAAAGAQCFDDGTDSSVGRNTDIPIGERPASPQSRIVTSSEEMTSSDELFGSAARLGVELAILVAATAVVAMIVVVVSNRRRKRAAAADTRLLIEASAYQ